MARRTQDIPIRPRYGYSQEQEDEHNATGSNTHTTATSNAKNKTNEVSSSYSEIPFLAQYPGAVPDHALQATNQHAVGNNEADHTDEDNSESDDNSKTPKRPTSLHYGDGTIPYELEGSEEGEMRHFVAANLEQKLRSASVDHSASVSHNSTPSANTKSYLTRHFLLNQLPQVDANVLSDIENEAQYLAASVDNLSENLCNLLHSISSITADNVEVHKNAVNKLTDSMDANIKCMYTIMAKTEEISKAMKPSEQLGLRIKEIKRLVDMLESTM